jgi:hypothetical protein
MSQETATLQQASVRQYCKAVRVPVRVYGRWR